ncbi:MAG: DUF5685 family protein, partial [Clostridia bacterium]
MFGYVMPDKPNMFVKDFSVYKAFYCGLCKTIGRNFGQIMRFSTNYDMTFLNILSHAVFDKDVVIVNRTCILNPLKKRSVVKKDEISLAIIHINNIMLHYKCVDDVVDNRSLSKGFVDKIILRRHYKKAKKIFIVLDEMVKMLYSQLRELEDANCGKIDVVCDKFARIMVAVGDAACGDKYNDNLRKMFYGLGKWIYVADAIDDIQQ